MEITKTRKNKSVLIILMATAVTAALVFAAVLFAWHRGAFLPGWAEWCSRTVTSDEGPDIILKDRIVTVCSDGDAVWRSPKGVQVQDILYEDIDGNGKNELMLLCWKIGRYGNVKPAFGPGDENRWFQHIYIYEFRDGTMRAIWMASDIGPDARSWSFEDGIVLIMEPSGRETKWAWYDWGLELAE